MTMVKLSSAQIRVVDCLRQDPIRFVKKSKFYDFQEVSDNLQEHSVIIYFKRPTFDVLVRLGILKHVNDKVYQLNPEIKFKDP